MTQNAGMAIRDQEIISDLRNGMTGREVARKYGLTPGRISQIAKGSLDTEGPIDELRDWLVQGYLGDLAILMEIAKGPGRPVTSGKGDHVVDAVTGLPAYDDSPRNDAVRTAGQVRKNIATLMGAEKPAPKQLEQTQEWHEAVLAMKETSDKNRVLESENAILKARLQALEDGHVQLAQIVED